MLRNIVSIVLFEIRLPAQSITLVPSVHRNMECEWTRRTRHRDEEMKIQSENSQTKIICIWDGFVQCAQVICTHRRAHIADKMAKVEMFGNKQGRQRNEWTHYIHPNRCTHSVKQIKFTAKNCPSSRASRIYTLEIGFVCLYLNCNGQYKEQC